LSGENRCLRLLDGHSCHYVTTFGKSANRMFCDQDTTRVIRPACKNNEIALRTGPRNGCGPHFQNWNRIHEYAMGFTPHRRFLHNRKYMQIKIASAPLEQVETDALIVPV